MEKKNNMPPKVDPAVAAAQLLQNPQFMQLFQKAMGDGSEIPDEKDVKGREEWLKKLQSNLQKESEEEMKKKLEQPVTDEEGTWMHVMPEPGFCVKCTTHAAPSKPKEKIFINIVKHPRIAEPMPMDASEIDNDPEMKDSIRFRIPLSCSSGRPDKDKSGQDCRVYDVIVNPLTIQRCGDDPEFRRFVAALSMSWIGQKHEKNLNTDQFTNVNFKCKGTPVVQRIHLRRPGVDANGKQQQQQQSNANQDNKNALNNDIQLPKMAGTATVPQFAAGSGSANRKLVQEVDPKEVSSAAASSTQQKQQQQKPSFVLAKIGSYDWSKHQKPTKNPYFHETVPVEICAEITLQSISSIKEVDVRIHSNGKQLELRWIDDVDDDEDCEPFMVIIFDFPVEEDPVFAKFSKKSHTLTLRFKVKLPDEVELEERRSRAAKEEREKEEAAESSVKKKEQQELEARRTKYDRMQQEERDVMAQRKEFVENINAVQQGAVPPTLKTEIDNMPPDQARLMLMRLESKTRNNDTIDEMLDKMPEDVLFNVCNCIRDKLGLERKKAEEVFSQQLLKNKNADAAAVKEQYEESSGAQGGSEYNFAKKAENLFGVKMMNRYVFALDH